LSPFISYEENEVLWIPTQLPFWVKHLSVGRLLGRLLALPANILYGPFIRYEEKNVS
jgi:hypothetical protein